MRLHAVRAADDEDGRVHCRDRPLRLAGEIRVPRGVEERELHAVRNDARLLREDGDAALPLEGMGIEERVAVIDPSRLSEHPGAVQKRLGQRGLPRVHMREDADRQFFRTCLFHAPSIAHAPASGQPENGRSPDPAGTEGLSPPRFTHGDSIYF